MGVDSHRGRIAENGPHELVRVDDDYVMDCFVVSLDPLVCDVEPDSELDISRRIRHCDDAGTYMS